jgi:hypothetical protein
MSKQGLNNEAMAKGRDNVTDVKSNFPTREMEILNKTEGCFVASFQWNHALFQMNFV